MENGKISFHQWARTVMMALTPEDREAVLRAVESLGPAPNQWPTDKVSKLEIPDMPGNFYVLRANSKIRVLLQLTEDQTVEVRDVVFHDTLKLFANAGH